MTAVTIESKVFGCFAEENKVRGFESPRFQISINQALR